MKIMFKGAVVFFLAVLIFTARSAEATWEVIDDFISSDNGEVMLNTDECDFQFKYVDKQHQASDIDFELIFKINDIMNTVRISTNEVYSQEFSADIKYGHLGRLMSGGALDRTYYDEIKDLFKNSPKNPWNLKISHIRNSSIYQLALSYYWLNDSSQVYSKTITLSKDDFTLEAQCQEKPSVEIPGISASASSQYSPSYGPENTVDGTDSTYWIGELGESLYSLEYDLGGTYNLDELAINWYSSYYSSSDFDVLISEDGVVYSDLQTGLDDVSSIDLEGISASHIQIIINEVNNSNFPVIREVIVKGREP